MGPFQFLLGYLAIMFIAWVICEVLRELDIEDFRRNDGTIIMPFVIICWPGILIYFFIAGVATILAKSLKWIPKTIAKQIQKYRR